ncbi:MAG TPA: MoxR family ATPase [Candidatus Nanoarchaeia archaeon]|nr:MoxR family ATPase [Candidatus Nanoarchaeia archaeon]
MDEKTEKKMDAYREVLRDVYSSIATDRIYVNSRANMDFTYEDHKGEIKTVTLDPMTSVVINSAIVPKSTVLIKGGHGGGKTSMIEEVSSRLFDVPKKEIVAAMIRGNDDQNVSTLLGTYHMGKLIATGEEEVRWRKFVTCPIKIADEINRFPPTALNALFEIFNKGRVEFADQVYEVDDFELYATENPNDAGTYPMSKPFLDRFGISVPASQLPAIEDMMALSARRDDKIYPFKENGYKQSMKEAKEMEKIVADNVKMGNEALLYSIYLGQSLSSCIRGDFGDKSHSELSLEERCKGCDFLTSESLCRRTMDGFSGRAYLDLQRWAKAYSYFLNAFKNPSKPEVQLGIVESVAPFVFFHRVTPNEEYSGKDPFFGMKLSYMRDIAKRAREAYVLIKDPLMEIPRVLSGEISPDSAKINQVKKDLVVREHFMPIINAARDRDFRTIYDKLEETEKVSYSEVIDLDKAMTFTTKISPRGRTFLREKAMTKLDGGASL